MNFLDKLKNRRSYREFSNEDIDINIIIKAIEAAKYAPSGANKQPWTFCVIKDKNIKKEIRLKSEEIEKQFYQKISTEWEEDLVNLNVNTSKPFLEEAPYLIVIFKHIFQYDKYNNKTSVYYPDISVGIVTGMLISALTELDIQVLTYTPSPNKFLSDLLQRPDNEKPYLILVVGKGSNQYELPKLNKKSNDELIKIY